MTRRALVVGAGGQLGRDLIRAAAHDPQWTCVGLTEADLDITDRPAVRDAIAAHRPHVVINAAAYTDVERAEEDPDAARRVNADAAGIVAEEAARADAAALYVSTDFVFDGTATMPYEPDAPVRPLSVYGATKAEGEARTREANPRHLVVRTAWLYGPGGANFVEKILAAAATRPELRIVSDEIGSPTHTLDLAEALLALSAADASGTYHCVNAGACSRYEFAQAFLDMAGVAIPVAPCSAEDFPSKAVRPKYSVLSNARIEAAMGRPMHPWRDALADYMTRRDNQR